MINDENGAGRPYRRHMKLLEKISPEAEKSVLAQFPQLKKVIACDRDPGMHMIGISIFDHWINDDSEFHLLEKCEGEERLSRDTKFKLLWGKIFDETTVLTWRNRGRPPKKSRIVLKQYLDKFGYLNRCAVDTWGKPYMSVLLPKYGAIYVESWDETNYLYYNDRNEIATILNWAQSCGLHVLEPRP